MKRKEKECTRALALRKAGFSIKKIAKTLGVSSGSVHLWTKNICLTKEQEESLKSRSGHGSTFRSIHPDAMKKRLAYYLNQRLSWQEKGRKKAREKDAMHASGCMLYWGEGSKTGGQIEFTNSDPNMMLFFIKFLHECFGVSKDMMYISISCYTDMKTQSEIENYWLKSLCLSLECLKTTTINSRPISSLGLRKKTPFGTCKLRVRKSGAIFQQILGSLREYTGYEVEWIRYKKRPRRLMASPTTADRESLGSNPS